MKRLLCFLTAILLSFSTLPIAASAIETDEKELDAFLEGIGWEKQAYIDYLASKDWLLEDFYSVDELGTPLSEESILPVLEDYELSREELNDLLVEYGEIEEGQDVLESEYIVFSEDLYEYVEFYLYGYTETVIDEENLQALLDDYGFASKEDLEKFLQKYDDTLENYEYIEDLEVMVDYYQSGGADLDAEIEDLFTEIQLTEEEMEKLIAHMETLNYEDPAFLEELISLSDRMMAFEDFEATDELSAEQIAELLDISNSLLNLMQMNVKYYFVVDGVKEELSIETMMGLTSTNGADMLIEIYNSQGELLADMLLTAEMFGSELIKETGNDLKEVEEIVESTPEKVKEVANRVKEAKTVKTVKGGELPKTASNYLQNALIGMAIIILGAILLIRARNKGMQ